MAVLDDKRWKVDELEGTVDEPKMVEITIETNQVSPCPASSWAAPLVVAPANPCP